MGTSLSIEKQSRKDGNGYLVSFEEGEALLQPGPDGKQIDIVWFGVDPLYQGLGVAENVLKQLNEHFGSTTLAPCNMLPEALPFWEKMASRGYCSFPSEASIN